MVIVNRKSKPNQLIFPTYYDTHTQIKRNLLMCVVVVLLCYPVEKSLLQCLPRTHTLNRFAYRIPEHVFDSYEANSIGGKKTVKHSQKKPQ